MKIILCSHDGHHYFGGPYEWAKRIGKEWRNRGYEVVYLFLSDHPKNKSSVYQYVLKEGFEAHHLCFHSLTQWHDNTEDRVQWFVQKAKQIKPDVFIANITLEALYACPQIEKIGIKTFGVYHTDDKRFLWFKDLFVSTRKNGPSNIVFVSQLLLKKHGIGKSEYVIGCGAPLAGYNASFNSLSFKLVYVGKITNDAKRIIDNVKAFITILENHPNLELEFHLYGDGDMVDELKQLIIPYQKNIFYHGFLPSGRVQQEISQYQAFVLLSDYEGLPISVMEAMAVGLVPICLEIESGIPELIDNNINGLIVKNRGEAFENVIIRLINDREKWLSMSLAAIEKIKSRYSTQAIADLWDVAFREAEINKHRISISLPGIHPLLQNRDQRKKKLSVFFAHQINRLRRKVTSHFPQ